MKLAMVGLGKMGANMAKRLMDAGHQVVGYNHHKEVTDSLTLETELIPSYSLAEAVGKLEGIKIVWLMIPAGEAVESSIEELSGLLSEGDIVIDGGNSNFNDTIRRSAKLAEKKIQMVDAGVSGGIWGLAEGYSMMMGGSASSLKTLTPIFEALAPGKEKGWGHVGPSGSGHFVKMVHNGIEYGLMQSYAEGFEIMKAREGFNLDLHQIAQIWQQGSVVRSWLLELTALALEDDQELSGIDDWVADSGEGRWTVFEAINQDVPAPIITLSLLQRFRSRQESSYSAKILAALRQQFGGHAIKKAD